jgi:alpha-tubulin suppressor-like RCC1 family protein
MRNRLHLVAVAFAFAALIATPAAGAQVMRWGSYFGGGGEGGALTQSLPTAVPGLEGGVTALAASNAASYVLKGGVVYAFGDGGGGELGNGTEKDSTTPVRVSFPAGVSIVAIGEARDAGFAVDSTGQGWAWGANAEGELCLGKPAPGKVLTPQKISGLTQARAVAGGDNHVLWLMADGTVEACGTNEHGELGIGEGPSKSAVPVMVPGLSNVVEVSAGDIFSAARESSGALYMWGFNEAGQIGDGEETEEVAEPFHVPLPGPASEVSCGGDIPPNGHTLALVGGEVYGWGADREGQIGDRGRADKPSPVATGLRFSQMIASGAYSLGLSGGELFAWGANFGKALGTGEPGGERIPTLVASGVSIVSATAENSLAY